MIDDYIDEFWIFNCPEDYSVSLVNDQVYNFFHQLFLVNGEEICQNQSEEIVRIKVKMENV